MTVSLDNFSIFGRVFFTHQDDRSSNAGKRVLDSVNGFQVRIDAGGFKQSLYDYRFVFPLGVENLDEFLVRLGLVLGLSRLWHSSSLELAVNRLRQSLYRCLVGHKGVRPRAA